jgi:predicted phage terminase large subunit-like protein
MIEPKWKTDLEKIFDNELDALKLGETLKLSLKEYIKVLFFRLEGVAFTFKPFHNEIITNLESWSRGELDERNLAVNMPVGWGKSVIIQYFITWCFGRNKNFCFLYVSHSLNLISKLSKECRDIIKSNDYYRLFGIKLNKDDAAKVSFSFENSANRTGLMACPIGANLTGMDAGNPHLMPFGGALIIDDPLDVKEARSQHEREQSTTDYDEKLKTRRRGPHIGTLLVMQRLHKEDLAGWTKQEDGESWKYVTVPALKNGISQWEEKNATSELLDIKKTNLYKFSCQYAQEPMVAGGEMIKTEWFRYYPGDFLTKTPIIKCFITSDTALSIKKSADYSVLSMWAMDHSSLYLIDTIRGRWSMHDLKINCKNFWNKWKLGVNGVRPSAFYMENKVSGISAIQDLKSETTIPIVPVQRGGKGSDKVSRLEAVLDYIAIGRVFFPEHRTYAFNNDFLNECESFTRDDSHKNDDQVDTLVDALDVFRGAFKKQERELKRQNYLTNHSQNAYTNTDIAGYY